MNEPRQLLEHGADDFERELLLSARGDRGSDGAMARATAVAVGAVAATATTSAAAGLAAKAAAGASTLVKPVLASALAKVVVATVVVASVGASGVMLARLGSESTAAVAVSASSPPRSTPAPGRSSPCTASSPEARDIPADPVQDLPTPERPRNVHAPAPSQALAQEPVEQDAAVAPQPEPASSDELGAEVRAIESARRAVEAGRGAEALALLDSYEKRYPGGRFMPEATLLRAQTLVRLGRREEAIALATSHLRLLPKSPVALRLRSLLPELESSRDGAIR
ncbi:MAG: tetratricopeptide repeat protein [Deltaproteobacteria bacterium]|nr:tetratricopeptide repeat protein [Deltaproteobacteria bacterium]